MRKFLTIFVLSSFLAQVSFAQQEPMLTQFMFNKLALNPGFAGNYDVAAFGALYRTQWVGMDGAPTVAGVNFHTPAMNDRVGVGLSLFNDRIGFTNNWTVSGMYAYRVPVGNGLLGIGLSGLVRNVRTDWTMANPGDFDESIPSVPTSHWLPNFGAGLFYDTDKFYAGLSVPYILESNVSYTGATDSDVTLAALKRHYYFMAGYSFTLSPALKLQPSILTKYVQNAPLDLDAHVTLLIMDRLGVGATYRVGGSTNRGFGESIDLVLQYKISDALRAGIAYDFPLSELQSYTAGSFEVMLEYRMAFRGKRLTNPRFFN